MLVLLPICLWVARVSSSAAAVEENREQIDVLQRLRQALADPDYRRLLRQHRTNRRRTSCLHLFRHISQKASGIHKVFPAFFVSSAEKSVCAIRTPLLCGIALMRQFNIRKGSRMNKISCRPARASSPPEPASVWLLNHYYSSFSCSGVFGNASLQDAGGYGQSCLYLLIQLHIRHWPFLIG